MFQWSFRQNGIWLTIFLLLSMSIIGCGGSQEEFPPAPSSAPPSSMSQTGQPRGTEMKEQDESSSLTAVTAPDRSRESASPASRGSVLANRELGMVVTGKGVTDPYRSLDALEEQILVFLPELREVYEHERALDPGLMGSLDVHMTIESQGAVSDLRFPTRRISSEKLVGAVFDRMRAWSFPPANEQVQLRYTLLFVPAGVDLASIVLWEKHLATRTVMDHETKAPMSVAAADRTVMENETKAPTSVAASKAPVPAKKPLTRAAPRRETEEPEHEFAVGWYRVTRPASLYAAPREASEVVSQLQPGMRVRVVALAAGEWLEIHSITDRPPGFLHREDAIPDSGEWMGR